MARKRIELPAPVEAEIALRTARHETAETIFEAIGRAISVPTIRRRMVELRAGRQFTPSQPVATRAIPEDVPEVIPDTAPLEDLTRWIKRLEKAANKAEVDGNLSALSSIAAKVAALMALRHKSTPLPKADPNDNPDMKALAVQGRERLKKLAHGLFADR